MGKWNTVKFIRAFMTGNLGRKRVHGTYRVIDGDHCKVLVRATSRYGRPDGNNLIGINLSTDEHQVCFFHWWNTNCFTYRMNKELDSYNMPKLPANILDSDDPNLLASGIIDANDTEVLIELGDKPYLLHKSLKDDGFPAKWEGLTCFASLDRVENRVESIEAAEALVKDPVGMEQVCSLWWAEKQPDGFKPPELEEQYAAVLAKPLNPFDYGYTMGDLTVYSSRDNLSSLVPMEKLLEEPKDHRAKRYTYDRDKWNCACEKIKSRTPLEYEGLSTKKNRYSYHADHNERHGWIVRSPGGVYVSGKVQNKDAWDDMVRLDGWYKLHARVTRIKLR